MMVKEPMVSATEDSAKRGQISQLQCLSFLKIVEAVRSVDPEFAIQQLACLMYIAANEGCMVQDMADGLDMTQSSASRNVFALSKVHRLGKEGYNLVVSEADPAERRRKLLYLTPKGKKVVKNLLNVHASGLS